MSFFQLLTSEVLIRVDRNATEVEISGRVHLVRKRHLATKLSCGHLPFSERVSVFADLAQMFGGGCGSSQLGVVILGEEFNDFLDVLGDHSKLELSRDVEVQSHSKVLMFLASSDLHPARAIFKESLIGALERICHLCDDGSADMTDFQVVDMQYNGELFSLYDLVGNPGIIRIDFETNRFQILDKKRW